MVFIRQWHQENGSLMQIPVQGRLAIFTTHCIGWWFHVLCYVWNIAPKLTWTPCKQKEMTFCSPLLKNLDLKINSDRILKTLTGLLFNRCWKHMPTAKQLNSVQNSCVFWVVDWDSYFAEYLQNSEDEEKNCTVTREWVWKDKVSSCP